MSRTELKMVYILSFVLLVFYWLSMVSKYHHKSNPIYNLYKHEQKGKGDNENFTIVCTEAPKEKSLSVVLYIIDKQFASFSSLHGIDNTFCYI